MPILNFTDSDLRAGMPLEAGWYHGKLVVFKTEMNKNRDNVNYVPEFVLEDGTSSGRQQKAWISPKFPGWQYQLAKLWTSVRGEKLDMKSVSVNPDELEQLAKEKPELWVHLTVAPDKTGKLQNTPDDYLPGDAPDPTGPVPF